MSDDKCPCCGAKAIPPSLYDGLARYECGEGPCDPCPNAERLLAEARAIIARMTPVVEAAGGLRDYWRGITTDHDWDWHTANVSDAVDAYRGTR